LKRRERRAPIARFMGRCFAHPYSGYADNSRASCWKSAPDNPAGFPPPHAVFSARMFDLVKPQIATAADKLTHLRRFL
jgi:hypothetical protein